MSTHRPHPTRGRHRVAPADAGVTLVELLVGMSLMAVVLSLSTAAVLHMYGIAGRVESTTVAHAQLHAAFQRLDREVRYASDVTDAEERSGGWYVAYRITAAGVPTCVELRVLDTRLERSTWVENELATTRTGWLPLASDVRTLPSGAPLELLPPDATSGFERLRLRFGIGTGATAAETDVSFTAMNTVRDAEPSTCTEGRP